MDPNAEGHDLEAELTLLRLQEGLTVARVLQQPALMRHFGDADVAVAEIQRIIEHDMRGRTAEALRIAYGLFPDAPDGFDQRRALFNTEFSRSSQDQKAKAGIVQLAARIRSRAGHWNAQPVTEPPPVAGAPVIEPPVVPLTEDELTKRVTELAIDPLRRATREPWLWLEGMDYQVDVELPKDGSPRWAMVEVLNTSRRVLRSPEPEPRKGQWWVSIGATEDAYMREFGFGGCLAREFAPLADLVGEEWQETMVNESAARLTIDGTPVELSPVLDPDRPDIVRWTTPPEFMPSDERALVEVEFSYPIDPDWSSFTVTFHSYYCLGSTRIRMNLHAPVTAYRLDTNVFYGRSLESRDPQVRNLRRSTDLQTSMFTTGEKSLLWPGSGVAFGWHRRITRAPVEETD